MTIEVYKSPAGEQEVLRRYREQLDAWPIDAEHVRVPTREGETFVLVSGPRDAPPVVLLHGSGANATTWRDDVAAWSREFRVHAVDIVGEPGLSAPSRPPLKSDAVASWLDDVLQGLGIAEAAFVGVSLGGWTALDYAVRRPERVRRLALLCPGGLGRQKVGWLVRELFRRRDLRRSAAYVAGLTDERALDAVVLTFEHFKPRTERLPRFSDGALRRLGPPLLVIVGGRDVMFDSHGTARRVRACVPGAAVHVLPDVGHAIFGQTGTVSAFLQERG